MKSWQVRSTVKVSGPRYRLLRASLIGGAPDYDRWDPLIYLMTSIIYRGVPLPPDGLPADLTHEAVASSRPAITGWRLP